MGKKAGSNRIKRLAAPRLWDIERKAKRFAFRTSPGPYAVSRSYPLGLVVRDLAGLVEDARVLRKVLNEGKATVNGRVRREPGFPVGLFDVVNVPSEGAAYRLVPSPKGLLLSRVGEDEAGKKLCGVRSKVKARGGHLQYGFSDGRSKLDDTLNLSPGDAVLMEVPAQKIVSSVKLAKGSLGLVLSGERAGQLGKVVDVKKGTITREKMIKISLPSGEAELPARLVFPVGTDRPLITVSGSK